MQATLKRDAAIIDACTASLRTEPADRTVRGWILNGVNAILKIVGNDKGLAVAVLHGVAGHHSLRRADMKRIARLAGKPDIQPEDWTRLLEIGANVEATMLKTARLRSVAARTARHYILTAAVPVSAQPAPAGPSGPSSQTPTIDSMRKRARVGQAGLAASLHVGRGAFAVAAERKAFLALNGWAVQRPGLVMRSTGVKAEVRKAAQEFWHENTTESPHMRDKARLRLGVREYATHAIHLQYLTSTELYLLFLEKYPLLVGEIGQRSFDALRPYYVRTRLHREVCMCVTCHETRLSAEAHFDGMTQWGEALLRTHAVDAAAERAPPPPCVCKAGSLRCPYSYVEGGALKGHRCRGSLHTLGDTVLCPIRDDALDHDQKVRAPPHREIFSGYS